MKHDWKQPLQDGDLVQIGVATKPGDKPPFVWIFKEKLKVKKVNRNSESLKTTSHVGSDALGSVHNKREAPAMTCGDSGRFLIRILYISAFSHILKYTFSLQNSVVLIDVI